MPNLDNGPDYGVVRGLEHAHSGEMLIVENFAQGVDLPAGDVMLVAYRQPLLA
ncbi:hypothetical protein D3C87_2211410 [compost metagenome]